MNNDELKKKIMSVIYHTFVKYPDDANHYEHWRDHIADEFIAAGIGDVKEAEHRAEVAELVVKNLNDIFTFDYQTVFEQAEKELREEKKDE